MKSRLAFFFTLNLISALIFCQNRSSFYYLLGPKTLNQPPSTILDSLLSGKNSRGNGLVFREFEITEKANLVYKKIGTEKKDAEKKEAEKKETIFICGEPLRCNITLNAGVPIVDFWQIAPEKFDAKFRKSYCVNPGISLNGYRFELDLTRDSIGAAIKAVFIPFRSRTWGLGVVPYRIRIPVNSIPASVAGNLGIVGNYGWTFGKALVNTKAIIHYSVTVGPFLGLTTADLKKETVTDQTKLVSSRSNPAVSFGGNLIFARNNMGLVISFGFDHNLGENANLWIYQDTPWIGLGLNLGLGYF